MADHKIRADCWTVMTAIAESGGNVYSIPPGKDGWHSRESIAAWLAPHLGLPAEVVRASFANIDQPGSFKLAKPAPAQPAATMSVQAAFDSGRITAQSRPEWERRFAADPQSVGETLATLAPVLSAAHQAAYTPKTAAEELDELDDALFGVGHSEMSRQRQRAREDEQVLAQHREIERQQAEAANAPDLTDEERAQLFQPPRDA